MSKEKWCLIDLNRRVKQAICEANTYNITPSWFIVQEVESVR